MARVSRRSKKQFFIMVDRFAPGSTDGGSWEDRVGFVNDSPEEVFEEALDYLRKQGYASQTNIRFCDREGE